MYFAFFSTEMVQLPELQLQENSKKAKTYLSCKVNTIIDITWHCKSATD